MKKILWILPLLFLFACNNYRASRGPADWIYVSTTGNDGTGDGTSGNPYLTIATAISHASAGDTVFVKAGTYTISTQVAVGVAISLYTTEAVTIKAGAALNPMFYLASATENTNGNQSISGFTFDGDSLALIAIQVKGRGNVKIHGNTFNEFLTNAVRLTGKVANGDGPPVTAAEDNYVYNNTFTECGGEVFSTPYYYASGAISLGGQKDARVYSNTINNNTGNYAYGINTNSQGYNAGCWITENTIYTSPRRMDTYQWNFAIELWNNRGGMIVRDNFVTGSIDFGGYSTTDSAAYGFAALCEHNTITQPALQQYPQTGIIIESDVSGGVQVIRNLIKYCSTGIGLNLLSGPADVQSDITIAYNIIAETLTTGGNYTGRGINHGTAVSGAVMNRLKILNNTFYNSLYVASAAVHFASSGVTYNDTEIRNNISRRCYNAIRFENNTIAGLDITNNIFYLHTNATSYVSVTASDTTTTNNIGGDPLLKSDLRIPSNSPAYNAGINVGLTTDYFGHRVPQNDTVDIGAHEYGDYLIKIGGKFLRTANGKLIYIH